MSRLMNAPANSRGYLRHVALLAGLLNAASLAGCKGAGPPPDTFGVNLTVRVDARVRPQLKSVTIEVGGAEVFQQMLDVRSFTGDEARVHYDPAVKSGTLTFTGTASDAGGKVIARGQSADVTLVAGKSATAVLNLAPAGGDGGVDAPIDAPADAGVDRRETGGETRPAKKGESCADGTACEAGLSCADGLCCDSKCDGACSACNLVGREGTCSPVAAGSMPSTGHESCGPDAASTCQRDGTCDGAGACRLWPVGTSCRASKCDMTTDAFTPEFKCDGKGVCETNVAIACAPFKCKDTSVCWATCTDNTQCVAGKTCTGGSCGLKPKGAICTQAGECADGNCAGGVCCDKPCQAGCESCDLPNTRGTCTNVPAGMDPKGICPAGSAENAVCSPGGCEGSGGTACRRAPTTTTCRVGSCATGMAINPATCAATGVCQPLTQMACGVYTCGATACNSSCRSDADCVGGYYCAAGGSCQAKKAGGIACATSNECQAGLTCLDGVCCTSSACPACRNCGATGTCTVVVASADDNTGATCSGTRSCNSGGTCLAVNGQSCGGGTSCVSGNCVDGVCCNVASCGACRNCGTSGTCSVTVANADDATNVSCANDQSCDGTATCKTRWSLVGKVATVEAPNYYFSAGSGNYIYFANANNSGGGAQFFKSFNVVSALFADESKVNNPLCDCGYEGVLVGQPLNNRVYYAANTGDAKYFSAGAASWTVFPGGYPAPRGEAATAVLGKRVYYVGGRGSLASVQAYDTSADVWITAGIKDAPAGIDSGCAGAFNGVVYAFGGRSNNAIMAYTEATNTWTTLAGAGTTPPAGCYYKSLPVWRSKLVMADSALESFNPTLQQWEAPTPLPALANAFGWTTVIAGASNDLYVLAWTGGAVYIYKWVFN